ncbi:hypothetical protein J2X20_001684 [Pelomonas saccharophila]|uniref:Uncharacterized protein n=1 Tax=Roseateles saccharophilus TaxID=304 RepID=A0ABU1YJM2_ROSSA|nr:hypothetical protein [Roseateles saccharophilus]MDR7269055.1 hypothetical protein [Roseateles saccharophilus]
MSLSVIAWMGWHWWPHWGLAFAAEDAPLAWWQAALLVANATAAAALACVHAAMGGRQRAVRWWTLLALGMVFAALDERFMAHEAVQDWLQFDLGWPRRWAQGVILVYALGGLALLRAVWAEGSATLRRWAIAALAAGAAAIALDLAFDTIAMQIVEEGLEALAETLLLAGLFSELGSAASPRR